MASHHTVQLYHATLREHVDKIKAAIHLDQAQPRTDFSRERKAFYLTDDLNIAKNVMAEEVRAFTGRETAIMAFSLNVEHLKVKTFSREKSGPTLDEWRGYVGYCRAFKQPDHPHPIVKEDYDVIAGWMSTRKGGKFEPIDSHVWQYAILTEKGVAALKFEKVE